MSSSPRDLALFRECVSELQRQHGLKECQTGTLCANTIERVKQLLKGAPLVINWMCTMSSCIAIGDIYRNIMIAWFNQLSWLRTAICRTGLDVIISAQVYIIHNNVDVDNYELIRLLVNSENYHSAYTTIIIHTKEVKMLVQLHFQAIPWEFKEHHPEDRHRPRHFFLPLNVLPHLKQHFPPHRLHPTMQPPTCSDAQIR